MMRGEREMVCVLRQGERAAASGVRLDLMRGRVITLMATKH